MVRNKVRGLRGQETQGPMNQSKAQDFILSIMGSFRAQE